MHVVKRVARQSTIGKCAARDTPVPGENCPAVLIAPGHYIQGANIIDSLGRYVHKLVHGCDQVGLFITAGGLDRIGDRVKASFAEVRVACDVQTFGGVCSYEEVDTAVAKWSASGIKAVIAIGGGSCHDCGKLAAYKLKVPMVVVLERSGQIQTGKFIIAIQNGLRKYHLLGKCSISIGEPILKV